MATLLASLKEFRAAGMDRLRAKSVAMTDFLERGLLSVGEATGGALEILTPTDPEARGCQPSVVAHGHGKALFDHLTQHGVIVDWREPAVIRMAPVPLYNRFADVADFLVILEQGLRQAKQIADMKSMRYVVIGIGKYGSRIATEMAGRGAEVFAIDNVEERVEQVATKSPWPSPWTPRTARPCKSQKLEEMDAAVVAIGENFEATVLTTLNLMDLGIPRVIVRASGSHQERILRKLGIQEILTPETEFASLVAERLMNPNLRGFLELPDDYEIAEIQAPAGCVAARWARLTSPTAMNCVDHHPPDLHRAGRRRGAPHRHFPTRHHRSRN